MSQPLPAWLVMTTWVEGMVASQPAVMSAGPQKYPTRFQVPTKAQSPVPAGVVSVSVSVSASVSVSVSVSVSASASVSASESAQVEPPSSLFPQAASKASRGNQRMGTPVPAP